MTANERIIDAALHLMSENGVAGITMSAIAARARVARQTLYNQYSDVEAVVFAATSSHQQESIKHLSAVLGTIDAPASRLEHLVRHSATLAAHGHPTMRGGFSPPVAELVAAHDLETRRLIETALRDGIDRSVFRDDLNVQRDALLLQRMIEGVADLVAAEPEQTAEIVTTAVRSVLGAVQS